MGMYVLLLKNAVGIFDSIDCLIRILERNVNLQKIQEKVNFVFLSNRRDIYEKIQEQYSVEKLFLMGIYDISNMKRNQLYLIEESEWLD